MTLLADGLAAHLSDAHHSETLLINESCARLSAQQREVYRFGFGQSPFPIPDRVVLRLRQCADRKEYLSVQGLPELREAVARFHHQLDGLEWRPERIVVGAGSKILLFCLMAAVRDADVALVAPSWVSYEPQARLAGHRVYRLPTDHSSRWRLMPEQLEQFCQARADKQRPLLLVLNYPGNPDGQTYDAQALAALAEVLRRHRVYVISDEIYGPLHHRGEHYSLAHFYPEGTLVTSGLSKWCGAGGWRLGVAHIPEALGDGYLQRVIGVASETYSCVSTPVQLAAVGAYQFDRATQDYLAKQRAVLATIGNHCAEQMAASQVKVHAPEGAFYLFPDFSEHAEGLRARGIEGSSQMTAALLQETGVALLPGSAFGMPESSLTARLAYVDFDGAKALSAKQPEFDRIKRGMDALVGWFGRL